MAREEREELAKRTCNFYKDAANQSIKTTVNYFKKIVFQKERFDIYSSI